MAFPDPSPNYWIFKRPHQKTRSQYHNTYFCPIFLSPHNCHNCQRLSWVIRRGSCSLQHTFLKTLQMFYPPRTSFAQFYPHIILMIYSQKLFCPIFTALTSCLANFSLTQFLAGFHKYTKMFWDPTKIVDSSPSTISNGIALRAFIRWISFNQLK